VELRGNGGEGSGGVGAARPSAVASRGSDAASQRNDQEIPSDTMSTVMVKAHHAAGE